MKEPQVFKGGEGSGDVLDAIVEEEVPRYAPFEGPMGSLPKVTIIVLVVTIVTLLLISPSWFTNSLK